MADKLNCRGVLIYPIVVPFDKYMKFIRSYIVPGTDYRYYLLWDSWGYKDILGRPEDSLPEGLKLVHQNQADSYRVFEVSDEQQLK